MSISGDLDDLEPKFSMFLQKIYQSSFLGQQNFLKRTKHHKVMNIRCCDQQNNIGKQNNKTVLIQIKEIQVKKHNSSSFLDILISQNPFIKDNFYE